MKIVSITQYASIRAAAEQYPDDYSEMVAMSGELEYITADFFGPFVDGKREVLDGLTISCDDGHDDLDAMRLFVEHVDQYSDPRRWGGQIGKTFDGAALNIWRTGQPFFVIQFSVSGEIV